MWCKMSHLDIFLSNGADQDCNMNMDGKEVSFIQIISFMGQWDFFLTEVVHSKEKVVLNNCGSGCLVVNNYLRTLALGNFSES